MSGTGRDLKIYKITNKVNGKLCQKSVQTCLKSRRVSTKGYTFKYTKEV